MVLKFKLTSCIQSEMYIVVAVDIVSGSENYCWRQEEVEIFLFRFSKSRAGYIS